MSQGWNPTQLWQKIRYISLFITVWRDEKSLWCRVSKAAAWGCDQLRGKEASTSASDATTAAQLSSFLPVNFSREKTLNVKLKPTLFWFPRICRRAPLICALLFSLQKSFSQCQKPFGHLDVGLPVRWDWKHTDLIPVKPPPRCPPHFQVISSSPYRPTTTPSFGWVPTTTRSTPGCWSTWGR